jgi:cell wall-associated NlpC family hydrolase
VYLAGNGTVANGSAGTMLVIISFPSRPGPDCITLCIAITIADAAIPGRLAAGLLISWWAQRRGPRVTRMPPASGAEHDQSGGAGPRRPHAAAPAPRRAMAAAARIMALAALSVLAGLALPAGWAGAAPATTPTSLKATLAAANKLSNEIDSLSQQYDALRIQLAQARTEAKLSQENEARDEKLLASGDTAVGEIAAQGYMSGGVDPALELLQTNSPQQFLNQASIMLELQQENTDRLSTVAAAETAARRAELSASQEERQASKLATAMRTKRAAIQAKENVLNSAAFSKAMTVYRETGKYPVIQPSGDSVGVQALRYALTRIGDPYVYAAAGPNEFDCSGLVVWAYAQIGISLPHYTGWLWNEGVHIPRSELEPGDLVFFYQDIGHVGIYVGDGLMVDAPTWGQDVQIQPVMWNVYVGAVRIA